MLRKSTGPLLVLFAALVAVAPQFVRGNSCGHDFNVHLGAWLDCLNAWRHGILYPHWMATANYNAGEPRFVFYPPMTWVLGALLGWILHWTAAPIALTFLTLAGTGLATRALALEICEDAVATLAGCAAIFSGFTLFTAYERTAFPEAMGGIWLPLLLLYALREHDTAGSTLRRALDGSTAPLAVVLGAAWLSNAPLGVIASYLLAAVALIAAVMRKSWAPILRAAVASALGLGATAFYWIPAKVEQKWVNIREATDDPGYNFENNWAFAHHADPQLALHDQILHQVSWIAVTMIAVALICAIVCWRRGILNEQSRPSSRALWFSLAIIPAAVLIILFPISRPVWHLPEWQFLQYPWRWMEAVEAPMSIFFAAAVWPSSSRRQSPVFPRFRFLVVGLCAAAFAGAMGYAATNFFQACWVEDSVASYVANFRSGPGFEGMYEYEPPNSDISFIATGLPAGCLTGNPQQKLGKPGEAGENPVWTPSDGNCSQTFAWEDGRNGNPEHRRMKVTATQNEWLVLRLLSYPSWSVKVNGQAPASLPARADGLIAVPVSPGTSELTVDWTTPPDVIASRVVTSLGLLGLAVIAWLERSRSRQWR